MTEATHPRVATLERMRALHGRCELANRLAALASDGRAPESPSELPGPEDVLSLDRRCFVDMLLEMNGPTSWIRFTFYGDGEYASACYYSTAHTENGAAVDVDLSDSEAELFASTYSYGLDFLGSVATGRAEV